MWQRKIGNGSDCKLRVKAHLLARKGLRAECEETHCIERDKSHETAIDWIAKEMHYDVIYRSIENVQAKACSNSPAY